MCLELGHLILSRVNFWQILFKSILNLSKVGIIYINNDYGGGLKDAFQKEFEKKGGKVVITEAIPEAASDVKTQLIKIKSKNPEGVFLATFAKEMGLILKQAKELDVSPRFFGGEGTKDLSVIEIGGEGSEGLIGTIPATVSGEERNFFLDRFQEVYGQEPGITADAAYDIPFLLKQAIEECASFSDVDCLKSKLLEIKEFEGASGKIEFDVNGDVVGKSYDLIQIKNGQFIPYED